MGVVVKGSFKHTDAFFKRMSNADFQRTLDMYAQQGVLALAEATPKDTGLTANSWGYEIEHDRRQGRITITWTNSNVVDEWANVAVLIQYGHATRNGGYVQGRDYINPALRPIFDGIADAIWEEVTR